MTSLEIEGAQARHHLVEAERARHRRLGASQAADALAKPAGGPDRRRRDGALSSPCPDRSAGQCRAIDDVVTKADVATEQQRGAARTLRERALRPFQCAGDAQELGA